MTERGSRFLALARRVDSAEAALAVREASRREHHSATHHVFAVRLADGSSRYDDDGEPSGTAGRPLLGELESRDLADAVVVVVRWFGGTKLGTGGLARAYGSAAAAALDAARSRSVVPGEVRHVRYGFDDTGAVARILEAVGAERGPDRYGVGGGPLVRTEVRLPAEAVDRLASRLREATAGRAALEPDDDPKRCWIAV
ncbi:MAG: YigZ family protein [Gemmatimonadota bacterium]